MSAELGVENIIVAADISKKRENIAKNLRAWLKAPHLGMISILTAGDKHFFRHVETMKRQTGIDLNLWGSNPLEVTHFKAGFLGVPPDFEEERVYISSASKQMRYQRLRLKAMMQSYGYFNSSLWDTMSGEYYRSIMKKTDYFSIFDYWTWEERIVDQCLARYDWEKGTRHHHHMAHRRRHRRLLQLHLLYRLQASPSTTPSGATRSAKGKSRREEAMVLICEENRPRYPNIKWYLDAVGFDFTEVVKTVNAIPRLYEAA